MSVTEEKPSAIIQTESEAVDTLAILQSAIEVKQDELDKLHGFIDQASMGLSRLKDEHRQQEAQTALMVRQKLAECDAQLLQKRGAVEQKMRELEEADANLQQLRAECAPELAQAEAVKLERQRQIIARVEIEQQHSHVQGMLKDVSDRLASVTVEQSNTESLRRHLEADQLALLDKEKDFATRQESVTLREQDVETREKNLAALKTELEPQLKQLDALVELEQSLALRQMALEERETALTQQEKVLLEKEAELDKLSEPTRTHGRAAKRVPGAAEEESGLAD